MILNKPGILITVSSYLVLSIALSTKFYKASKSVVDELFHLPQGLSYCHRDLRTWDPKITTLPGLYIFSTLICTFIGKCTISCLRITNILASAINLILFYVIRQQIHPKCKFPLFNAINLALIPPLLFFSQLYYTDVPSVTSILGLIYFCNTGHYVHASLTGLIAILMRQTNVLFVFLFAGLRLSGLLYNYLFHDRRFINKDYKISKKDIFNLWQNVQTPDIIISKFVHLPMNICIEVGCFLTLAISFITFVIINGGIVVGDKSAHVATLHIPQLYYFSIFSLFFGWPHFVKYIIPFITSNLKNVYSFFKFISTIFIIYILYLYTHTTHPYLLADNRHYMFYIWKRFFNCDLYHFLWSPIFYFSLYTIFQKIYNEKDVRFAIFFTFSSFVVLCFQALVDIRYFLIPYVILRLYMKDITKLQLIAELLTFVLVNCATFYLFFTKEIIWNDFADIQRLIW
ncbi:PREDICTED: putative Dol-P-Glc:Glc(2)Man(9)GlcNAc(2)-PP-Dol alpha-1,2-glucosyltransferase [Nicrophorus vespilloides]|uniref:Dol-P-Glc:Glc(2)Man(9)GlcNAc(2)-PP-Dol alpha-1,2-glucosyltransferase n=1 Tax=Nicrophorus vespilloides TaxID=110193 RepID=A0ABM1NAH9_NICVS|nr:PREDICTED: putative Dol-P-Glc:Glc(2)Man(9)GlcNAc(2)-PP-Dol alpha-1,2-glucosyltransferase [Nicrophorus vespilloides]